jgi:hypothetical protein
MKLTPPEIYEIMRDLLGMMRNALETDVMDPVKFYGFYPQEVVEIPFQEARRRRWSVVSPQGRPRPRRARQVLQPEPGTL